jgi:hypothetical protein
MAQNERITWRQAIPYQPLGQQQPGAVLKQNTGRQAAIITYITRARAECGGSITRLKTDPRAWRSLRSRVANTIRIMPLWKLQTIAGQRLEFLYPCDDSISTTRPRRSLSLSGAELIHSPAASSGAAADSEVLYSVEVPNDLRISFVKPVA